jgi:hypothetical protein
MAPGKNIGTPYTLASIPRPITVGGRSQAAGVCSISGTKKRKRTEVAVAVDGEGILIYSVCTKYINFLDSSLPNV